MKRTNHNKLSFRKEFLSGFNFLGYDDLSIIGIKLLVKAFFQLIRLKQIHATRVKRTLSAGKGVGATMHQVVYGNAEKFKH